MKVTLESTLNNNSISLHLEEWKKSVCYYKGLEIRSLCLYNHKISDPT